MAEKTTFTQSVIPAWYTNQAQDLLAQQKALSAQPYQPYQGQRIAGFNETQQQGFDATKANAFNYKPTLDASQSILGGALGRSTMGAAQPYLTKALDSSAQQPAYDMLGRAADMTMQGTNALGIQMAQPYLDKAGGSAVDNISTYMNPYMDKVIQGFADAGARNLQEKLIPAATSKFINAGQLGGGPARGGGVGGGAPSGYLTDTARALRDTQDSVNKQTADLMMQGWNSALGASQADLSRYGQLASTAGQLGGQAQANYLTAAGQMGTLGGQLSQMGYQQQSLMADVAGKIAQAYGQDTANQMMASGQLAQIAQQMQSQGLAGAKAITDVGGQEQALKQANLDLAYKNFQDQSNYAQNQINQQVSTMGGLAGAIPTGTMAYENTKVPKVSTLQTIAGLGTQLAGAAIAGGK